MSTQRATWRGRLAAHLAIARPDHWFKNVFIVPGLLLARFFVPAGIRQTRVDDVVLAFAATCLVASSNYVINEILDAPGDRRHPDKCRRPIPSGRADVRLAYLEWLALMAAGLWLAHRANPGVLGACAALWIMGLAYNVRPLRTKDTPYLDVLSESVNNPIRLAIGWSALGAPGQPTLSVLLAYWMFGAFLMAIKRFAELRHIGEAGRAGDYRRSFRFYNEERLLVSILFYAAMFGMFSGVFISRYRMELVLAIPFVGVAMAAYLRMGFKPNSPAMNPERLWRHPGLMTSVGLAFVVCALLLFTDLPGLDRYFAPRFSPAGGL